MNTGITKPPQFQLNNLLSYYQNKKYVDAENLALSITKKYPSHQYAWKILAAVLEQTSRVSHALNANLKALEINPNDHEVYLCLGNNFNHLGNLADAELNYKKAISLKPDYVQAYYNFGLILHKMKRFDDSVSIFKQAIKLMPEGAQIYNALGLVLIELYQLEEAIKNFKHATKINPNFSQAFFNLGIAFIESGNRVEALKNFKHAILLNPNYTRAYNSCGITLVELGKHEEALENFKQAITLDTNYVEAYMNLGNALKELGSFDDSFDNFKKAIDLRPDYAECHNNYGRALLLNNKFKEAFVEMEWRLNLEELNFIPLNSDKPRWKENKNQKVFLLKEQGIGDFIMYSSMLSELNINVNQLIVECDPRLVSLLKRSFPNSIRYISDRSKLNDSDYDSFIPIGSLPLYYRTKIDDFFISSKGWLQADVQKVQKIKEQFLQKKLKNIIGISWKTTSLLNNSHLRNIELEELLSPFKKSNFVFLNLQYGEVSREISNLKLKYGIEILEMPDIDLYNDIDGLAALITACDCIITIDNLTSHLSGALSKNTKLLLPLIADERWGLDPKNSYLYKNITLYRQSIFGDWDEPINKIKEDLEFLF